MHKGTIPRRWRRGLGPDPCKGLALCILGLVFAACSPDETALALLVAAVPQSTTELRVRVTVDDQPARGPGSFAPPPRGDTDQRIGLRLLGQTRGLARIEVAACNSACLLALGTASVDLAQQPSQLAATLMPVRERLDLERCEPKAAILCNAQLERDPSSGAGVVAIEGSGFTEGATVYADGVQQPGVRRVSPSRIELDQITGSTLTLALDVRNPDGTSVLRRLQLANAPLDRAPSPIEPVRAVPTDTMPQITGALAHDLDDDGNVDLAVVGVYMATSFSLHYNPGPGFLVVYWGDGRGGFSRAVISESLSSIPRSIAAGRLKGPTQPPVIVIAAADPVLFVFVDPNPGTGTVYALEPTAPRAYSVTAVTQLNAFNNPIAGQTAAPALAVITDADGDAQPDLLVATSSSLTAPLSRFGGLYLWRSPGAAFNPRSLPMPKALDLGGLWPVAVLPWSGPTGQSPGGLAVAAVRGLPSGAPGELVILNGSGSGTFTVSARTTLGGLPAQLIAGDFTGDGLLDLALPDHYSATGTGGFRRLDVVPSPGPAATALSLELDSPIGYGAAVPSGLGASSALKDLVLFMTNDLITPGKLGLLMNQKRNPPFGPPTLQLLLRAPGFVLPLQADAKSN